MKTISLWVITVSLLSFSSSCRKKIPSGVLGSDAMGKILFDIGMAEEFAASYVARDSAVNKDSAIAAEVEKVMKIHEVSQEKFKKSYDFYKSRPDLLKVIIDTVHLRAQRDRQKLYRSPVKVE